MPKFGLAIFDGELIPKSLLGDSISPRPLKGELKVGAFRLGVNLRRGVELTLLWFEMSARMLVDLALSRRGRLADLFSGDPLPGTVR